MPLSPEALIQVIDQGKCCWYLHQFDIPVRDALYMLDQGANGVAVRDYQYILALFQLGRDLVPP